jgi:hypothetical protein
VYIETQTAGEWKMIRREKTDKELIQEAARALAIAIDGREYEEACKDMVEALRYGRDVQWWSQWEGEKV